MRLHLFFILSLLSITGIAQIPTWTGSLNSDWQTAANWNTSAVPASTDAVIINNTANQPVLDSPKSVASLTINSGAVLNLGSYNLTVSGSFTGNSATVNNGSLVTGSATVTNCTFGAKLTSSGGTIQLRNNTFNEKVTVTQTGSSNTTSYGNTFNDPTRLTNSSAGFLSFGVGVADVFNDSLFATVTASRALYLAHSSAGNQFNGYVEFNKTSTATSTGVLVGSQTHSSIFKAVVLLKAAAGAITTQNASFTNCTFDSSASLSVSSGNFTHGQVSFSGCRIYPSVSITTGSSAQVQLTGGTIVYNAFTSVSPSVLLGAVEFKSTCSITKTGSSTDLSSGPVICRSTNLFKNTGTGLYWLGGAASNKFLQGLSVENTGAGTLQFTLTQATDSIVGSTSIAANAGVVVLGSVGTVNKPTLNGNITLNLTGGSVQLNSLKQSTTGSITASAFSGSLTVNDFKQLGTAAINLSGSGAFTVKSGTEIRGDLTISAGRIYVMGGEFFEEVFLNQTGSLLSQGEGSPIFYKDVEFKCSGTGAFQLNYPNTTFTYHEDLILNNASGGLSLGYIGIHAVKGDVIYKGAYNINSWSNKILLNGTLNQSIKREHSFTPTVLRLEINKPSGKATLETPLIVAIDLSLQKGELHTTATNFPTLGSTATITGGSDSSYVLGALSKVGTTAFTFPLGGNGSYAPLGIDAVTSSCTFKANYIAEDPDSLYPRSQKDTTLGFVNRCGYWSLDRTSGTQNTKVTLGWSNSQCFTTKPSEATVTHWVQDKWTKNEVTSHSGTSLNGKVTAATVFNFFPAILNLEGRCRASAVGYIKELKENLNDTLILKCTPSNFKNYKYFYNQNLLQNSAVDSLLFPINSWGDSVQVELTSIDGCKTTTPIAIIKKSINICKAENSNSQSSTIAYSGNQNTCSCNSSAVVEILNGNLIDQSHDFQRIQNYDLRTVGNPGIPYNTPVKKLKFNIIVIGDQDNSDFTGNFNIYQKLFLEKAFLIAQQQFSGSPNLVSSSNPFGMRRPTDPLLPEEEESNGAKLLFELNKVIFINNQTWFNQPIGLNINSINSEIELNHDCDYQSKINLYLGEKRNPSDGDIWGRAPLPNCGDIGLARVISNGTIANNFTPQLIFGRLQEVLNENPDASIEEIQQLFCLSEGILYEIYRLGGHWAHEIAHNLDLLHTYDGNNDGVYTGGAPDADYPETNIISHFDFLSDVFSLDALNNNSSFCSPDPGLICYHQSRSLCPDFEDADNDNQENPCHIFATNNIMGNFNIEYGYISPLQVAKIQRALSLKSIRRYVSGSPYDSHPIEISSNQTWNMDIQLYNDIIVKSGSTFTVQCRIALPDQARIVVEPGAVLYLEGGTLTGFHKMWQGVSVLGVANQGQGTVNVGTDGTLISVNSPQGVVILKDGTIENAEEGIFVGRGFGDLQYDKTGGIVIANGAQFKNNFRSVAFNPYKPFSISKFVNCKFICDDHLKSPNYYNAQSQTWDGPESFVSMWDVKNIRFIDNTFENDQDYIIEGDCSTPDVTKTFTRLKRADGLGSYDARFIVTSTDPNNPTEPKRNEFKGLTRGIWVRHSYPSASNFLWCFSAHFDNVQYGITTDNSRSAFLRDNSFLIPDGIGTTSNPNYEPYGILLNGYRAHTLANNTFEAITGNGGYSNYGLVVKGKNGFQTSGTIINNSFNKLPTSFQAEISSPSLFTNCNEFTNTARAWNLFPENEAQFDLNDHIFQDQGTGCFPNQQRVGNKFFDDNDHIWSRAANTWRYFCRQSISVERPIFNDEDGISSENGLQQPCDVSTDPCAAGGGDGGHTITGLHNQRLEARTEMQAIAQTLNGWVEDNGNTTARLATIADTSITNDSLSVLLRNSSPLSDTVLLRSFSGGRGFSAPQLLSFAERNLPCTKTVYDSLKVFIESDLRTYASVRDTLLYHLQAYNPNYTTKLALQREVVSLTGLWVHSIDNIVAYYSEKDSLAALIPLYRDSLQNQGFEKELLVSYITLDSLPQARYALNALSLTNQNDSLFANYTDLYLDMKEDSITWLELDSAQNHRLANISRIPSDIQSYALVARSLRGDTAYHLYPTIDTEPQARMAYQAPSNPEKNKQSSSIHIFPNPNQGQFTLELMYVKNQLCSVHFTDLTGRTLNTVQFATSDGESHQEIIQLGQLSKGIYLCQVYLANGEPIGFERIVISK
jgi:hypothetical protein